MLILTFSFLKAKREEYVRNCGISFSSFHMLHSHFNRESRTLCDPIELACKILREEKKTFFEFFSTKLFFVFKNFKQNFNVQFAINLD